MRELRNLGANLAIAGLAAARAWSIGQHGAALIAVDDLFDRVLYLQGELLQAKEETHMFCGTCSCHRRREDGVDVCEAPLPLAVLNVLGGERAFPVRRADKADDCPHWRQGRRTKPDIEEDKDGKERFSALMKLGFLVDQERSWDALRELALTLESRGDAASELGLTDLADSFRRLAVSTRLHVDHLCAVYENKPPQRV